MFRKLFITALICTAFPNTVFPDSTRTNQGIYGAQPKSIAYDDVHHKIFLTAECALSCFVSADTAKNWTAAFPVDSLNVISGNSSRGWGGGARSVISMHGTTIIQTFEESSNRWAYVITFDGGSTWKTIVDNVNWNNWIQTRSSELNVAFGNNENISTVKTWRGKVYLGIQDVIVYSDDSCKTWKKILFPDSTAARAKNPDSTRLVFDIEFFGTSGDSFYVLGTGPYWDQKDGDPAEGDPGVGDNWKFMKTIYKTVNHGQTFTIPRTYISTQFSNTMGWTFDIDQIRSSQSGDTILLTDGFNSNNAGFFGSRNSRKAAIICTPDTVRAFYEQQPGQDMRKMSVFFDPSFPNGIQVFLGASRYTTDFTSFNAPVKIGYSIASGENPENMECMLPGAFCYIGSGATGPWLGNQGINGNFGLSLNGLEAISIYSIAQLPTRLDTVYLATQMGVSVTTRYNDSTVPYAQKWSSPHGKSGLFGFKMNKVAINPYKPLQVVAANGNGFRITQNGGFAENDWANVSFRDMSGGGAGVITVTGLLQTFFNDGGEITAITFLSQDTILASFRCQRARYGGVMQSFNAGVTWQVNTSVPDSCCNDVTVATDGQGTKTVYLAYGNDGAINVAFNGFILKNSGSLESWQKILINPLYTKNNGATLATVSVECIRFVPGQTDTACISLYKFPAFTKDGFSTVHCINDSTPPEENRWGISAITFNKTNSDSVFLAQGKVIWLLNLNPVQNDVSKPLNYTLTKYFTTMPGEIMYDILFDDLTMTSNTGFFSVKSNVIQDIPLNIKSIHPEIISHLVTSPKIIFNRTQLYVTYHLHNPAEVKITLLDIAGRSVRRTTVNHYTAGTFQPALSISGLVNGKYFLYINIQDQTTLIPFLMVK
ncbi:MAG: hypothetical protein JW915_08595 [Chitinispirillaceae bacterium]|nr:hypothetical protein [Chitinispirillaceae bacterium]